MAYWNQQIPDPQNPNDQAFLDAVLGLPPEDQAPEYQPQQFQGGNRFLEAFSGAQPQLPYAPQGFGQGFAQALLGSLSSSGQRIQGERQRFDALQEQRRKEVDAERRQSKLKREEQRFTASQAAAKEGRDTTQKQSDFERDNPLVTPELKQQYPQLSSFPPGTRVTKSVWDDVQKRGLPPTEAEKRSQATQDRLATAAARQAKAQEVSNIDKLYGNVIQDKDISSYPTIRDAYQTGTAAAARNNSAGDIILMRMIAKATDPTTGVREEEFKTFQGAQGRLADFGIRLTKDMWGGGKLTDTGRQELLSVLEGIHDRKLAAAGQAADMFKKQAQAFGVDPSLVLRDFKGQNPPRNAPPGTTRPPLSSFNH